MDKELDARLEEAERQGRRAYFEKVGLINPPIFGVDEIEEYKPEISWRDNWVFLDPHASVNRKCGTSLKYVNRVWLTEDAAHGVLRNLKDKKAQTFDLFYWKEETAHRAVVTRETLIKWAEIRKIEVEKRWAE